MFRFSAERNSRQCGKNTETLISVQTKMFFVCEAKLFNPFDAEKNARRGFFDEPSVKKRFDTYRPCFINVWPEARILFTNSSRRFRKLTADDHPVSAQLQTQV